jgi:hypothetical protein
MSLAFLYTEAFAALPQGTWTFERSLDYFGRTPVNQAPRFTRIVVRDKTVSLSDTCLVNFSPDLYLFSDVFQPLTKQGITDKQVDNFLMQNFKLSLLKTTEVYSLTSSPQNCADQVMEFFVVDDRLLIPMGATFFSYVKTGNGAATGTTADSFYSGYKQSRLPMDFERYYASCKPKIMSAKGRPQTSDKYAPDFLLYVVAPASNDELMKIVGNQELRCHWTGEWVQLLPTTPPSTALSTSPAMKAHPIQNKGVRRSESPLSEVCTTSPRHWTSIRLFFRRAGSM